MFHGYLGFSLFLGTYRSKSVYFTDRISCLVSLWGTRLRGILDFGEIMAQIGLFLDNKLDFKKHLDEKIHKRNLNLNDGKTLPIGLKTKFINHL